MNIDRVIRTVYDRLGMVLNDYNIETIAPFIDDSFKYGEIVSHMKNSSLYENVGKYSGVFCQYRPVGMICDEWDSETFEEIAKEIVGDLGVVDGLTESNIIRYGEASKENSHYQKDMHRKMVKNRFVPTVQHSAGGIKNVLDPLVKKQNPVWERTGRGVFQYHGSLKVRTKKKNTGKKRMSSAALRKKYLEILYERQKGICTGCLNHYDRKDMEIDHKIPVSVGGTDDLDNLQAVCGSCNRKKGGKGMEETFPGWEKRFWDKMADMRMEDLVKSGKYVTKEEHDKTLLQLGRAVTNK